MEQSQRTGESTITFQRPVYQRQPQWTSEETIQTSRNPNHDVPQRQNPPTCPEERSRKSEKMRNQELQMPTKHLPTKGRGVPDVLLYVPSPIHRPHDEETPCQSPGAHITGIIVSEKTSSLMRSIILESLRLVQISGRR